VTGSTKTRTRASHLTLRGPSHTRSIWADLCTKEQIVARLAALSSGPRAAAHTVEHLHCRRSSHQSAIATNTGVPKTPYDF
jgi:hypothetical protein